MNKKIYSIIYLVVIIFYLFRPVMPYLDYTFNKDYISKYLCVQKDIPGNCCQGKCYLHKQLEKNSIPDSSDKDHSSRNFQDKRLEDHLKSGELSLNPCIKDFQLVSFYFASESEACIFQTFVPPKF